MHITVEDVLFQLGVSGDQVGVSDMPSTEGEGMDEVVRGAQEVEEVAGRDAVEEVEEVEDGGGGEADAVSPAVVAVAAVVPLLAFFWLLRFILALICECNRARINPFSKMVSMLGLCAGSFASMAATNSCRSEE